MDRYARHQLIDWFSQEDLASSHVVVVGAGAVGNEVLKCLALLGVGSVAIFDFDRIEEHNLTRSVLFRDSDIGKFKADVAAARTRELDPNIQVTSHNGDFWDLLDIPTLKKARVLICCVDNFEARIRCNTLCLLAAVDLVNLGVDSRFASIEVFAFGNTSDGPCYECGLPHSVYERIAKRYSCGHLRKISFVEGKVPTTIVTSGIAASLGVSVALRLGVPGSAACRRILIDSITGAAQVSELVANPGCPSCSQYRNLPWLRMKGRNIGNFVPSAGNGQINVTLSEPVLTGYRVGDAWVPVFRKACEFDDSFASTVCERPEEVLVEIRDQFVLEELVASFSEFDIPSKFAIVETADGRAVFEFDGVLQ